MDSPPLKPNSETKRAYTRRAVWRCLVGRCWSSSSQRPMTGMNGPRIGLRRGACRVYRGGTGVVKRSADRAAIVVLLPGNLPDALALKEVRSSYRFALIHCKHPYLQSLG